jgi:hypothetical protein
MTTPPPNVLALPLEVRAEMAMREAFENLVEEYAREGRSLVLWRDGQVVEIPAEEIKALMASEPEPPLDTLRHGGQK